jgi:hypothetical protein
MDLRRIGLLIAEADWAARDAMAPGMRNAPGPVSVVISSWGSPPHFLVGSARHPRPNYAPLTLHE